MGGVAVASIGTPARISAVPADITFGGSELLCRDMVADPQMRHDLRELPTDDVVVSRNESSGAFSTATVKVVPERTKVPRLGAGALVRTQGSSSGPASSSWLPAGHQIP